MHVGNFRYISGGPGQAADICPTTSMFPTLGLFATLPCPDRPNCGRTNCVFSHDPRVVQRSPVHIPIEQPSQTNIASTSTAVPNSASVARSRPLTIPSKRPLPLSVPRNTSARNAPSPVNEPPSKLQRVGTVQNPNAVPTRIQTNNVSRVPKFPLSEIIFSIGRSTYTQSQCCSITSSSYNTAGAWIFRSTEQRNAHFHSSKHRRC